MDSGDWIKLILMMAAILVVTVVVVSIGAYLFLCVFANILNSRQSIWEGTATPLGFTADRTRGGIYKTLAGERNGFKIEINHAGLNPRMVGKMAVTDDGAEVRVFLPKPLGFP
ncbi:MAG TPA: hypothetical protein VJL58_11275, partial [Pyrinomonadaceae bacterium]|nr:hypothetical protein [Pyrinomonadaceae bacterium]